tara:strand:+ start:294 stop:719 length:426 start_codon:yes stop_codon:yes gene_type:complete
MEIIKNSIEFKVVKALDNKFLYKLLKERELINNISHKKMPTFSQHVKFVKSKPYAKWYIIYKNKKKCGTIYLSKLNEIGLQLKKEEFNQKIEADILKIIIKKNPRARYLVNVNPKNKRKIDFFKKNGFKLIQFTYEMIPEK